MRLSVSADVGLSCNPQEVPQRRQRATQRSREVSGISGLLSTGHFPLSLSSHMETPPGIPARPRPPGRRWLGNSRFFFFADGEDE